VPEDVLAVPGQGYACGIVNLDRIGAPGTHWCAWVRDPDSGYVEYFDPFGLPPSTPTLRALKAAARPGDQLLYNCAQCQDVRSSMCGRFCAAYLRARAAGATPQEAQGQFDPWPSEANERRAAAVGL
jgi:hypothetical protein